MKELDSLIAKNLDSSIQLLAFDFDGTLVDTFQDIADALRKAVEKFVPLTLTDEEIRAYLGTGVQDLLKNRLPPSFHVNPEDIFSEFRTLYEASGHKNSAPYPGMIETLEHFHSAPHSVPKIIVSNKSNQFLEPLLDQLDLRKYFLEVVGRHTFPKPKPDPMGLLTVCGKLKIDPSRVLMIGDTHVDILAGKNAGSKTCAALYGYGPHETLSRENPDFSIREPKALMNLLPASPIRSEVC